MMLSKQSEQFLIELRMYLISKGKNDEEINEITEELEDHLLEAQAAGKDISHIIGKSPKEYMKSIGNSMKTDFRQMMVIIPMMIFLVAAYFSIGPAIEGKFALSGTILWLAFAGGVMGILAYGILLFKVIPKFYHSVWGYVIAGVIALLVTGAGVVLLLWYRDQEATTVFVASSLQNNLIVAACIIIFIASALYSKSWVSIVIPIFVAIGPLANRFLPKEINEDPVFMIMTVIVLVLVSALGSYFIWRKYRKTSSQ
ncbi:hypothetical protein [Neobacillus dielmonensis]|uniref:hypothetical protein n=1 Tax=Neobacillus dielmonensis TaxID=1347369 RepID=UPI000694C095|nr:hypothetical protein [Neobacillus dielmonensis]